MTAGSIIFTTCHVGNWNRSGKWLAPVTQWLSGNTWDRTQVFWLPFTGWNAFEIWISPSSSWEIWCSLNVFWENRTIWDRTMMRVQKFRVWRDVDPRFGVLVLGSTSLYSASLQHCLTSLMDSKYFLIFPNQVMRSVRPQSWQVVEWYLSDRLTLLYERTWRSVTYSWLKYTRKLSLFRALELVSILISVIR